MLKNFVERLTAKLDSWRTGYQAPSIDLSAASFGAFFGFGRRTENPEIAGRYDLINNGQSLMNHVAKRCSPQGKTEREKNALMTVRNMLTDPAAMLEKQNEVVAVPRFRKISSNHLGEYYTITIEGGNAYMIKVHRDEIEVTCRYPKPIDKDTIKLDKARFSRERFLKLGEALEDAAKGADSDLLKLITGQPTIQHCFRPAPRPEVATASF